MGLVAQRADLFTDPRSSAREATDWVRNNGNTYTQVAEVGNPPIGFPFFGTKFDTFELAAGWSFDSRNRSIFADRGARHRLGMSYTLPGSDVEYFSLSYDYLQFVPINRYFTIMWNTELGYGDALGDTTSIPPFRNYFAGGPETVRGYRESRLGPKDSFGNAYGGNMKLVSQLELLLPIPEKWRNAARFSIFVDAGNVFSTGGVDFVGIDGVTPVDYKFGFDKLRASTGVAVQWLAPLGVFRFSYAYPLNDEPGGDASCRPTASATTGTRPKASSSRSDRLSEVYSAMRSKSAIYALLALATAMAPVAGAMAQTQAKIGFVNVSRLLAEAPQAQAASAALETEFASRRRDLENQQKDLKTREEKLQKDGAVMAENERRNAEKALREGQRELARKQNEFLEDLNVRRNEALGQLQRAVVQEIQAYAKTAGFDIVVADALYASPALDITTQVLTALQSRNKAPAPAKP